MPASGQSPRLDFLPDLIKIIILAMIMIIEDDCRGDIMLQTLLINTIFHLFLLAPQSTCSLGLPHTFDKSKKIADSSIWQLLMAIEMAMAMAMADSYSE